MSELKKIPTLHEFFEALYGGDLGGRYLEIRALSPPTQRFCTTIDEAVTAIPEVVSKNVYFGVGLRDEPKGTKEHTVVIPGLWVDLDVKSPEQEQEVIALLGRFEHKPSVVVKSGGGFHGYWLFREPEELTSLEDCARIEQYLRGMAEVLGGDPVVAEIARVLRVPGTYNHKFTPPKPVSILRFAPERRYVLSDFGSYRAEGEVHGTRQGGGGSPIDWESKLRGVPEHWRNTTAVQVAGRYFGRGLLLSEVWMLMQAWNAQNVPPLEERELRTCVESVATMEGRKRVRQEQVVNGAVRSLNELADEYTHYIERLAQRKIVFGLPAIDRACRGLVPGEVAFVLARSKVGKSLFVQNLLRWFAHSRQATLFVSLEQPGQQVFERYVQMEVGVSGRDVEEAWHTEEIRTRWLAQMAPLTEYCWTVDKGSVKIEEIPLLVDKARDRAGQALSCVAVDYLGYLDTAERGHTPYERTSAAARAMKQLAKDLELPFVVLAQVGREVGGEGNLPLTMDCGRDSGVVEEAADVQLGLYQPKMKVEEESPTMTLAVQVLANRKGPRTEEWYTVDRKTLRIDSEPVERENAQGSQKRQNHGHKRNGDNGRVLRDFSESSVGEKNDIPF
jgi:hypothetical protein